MFTFDSNTNFIIQGLLAVVVIGMFHNLMSSTKMYGGIIGQAVRLFGFGMLFITISVIERILINLNIMQSTTTVALTQDIFNLIGLVCLGIGFSKLAAATKA